MNLRRYKCLLWPHGWLYDGNVRHCMHCGRLEKTTGNGWYLIGWMG